MKGEEIIRYFEQQPESAITIHQLSTRIAKSYGWTYQHCRALHEQGIIAIARVGASLVCTLRATNELAIGALCFASSLRAATLRPNERQALASITRHLPHALAVCLVDGRFVVLAAERYGRHVIDGNDIEFVQPGKETLARLARGVIAFGYERFWRAWGEHHG
jgi:hypothetical protein